MVFYLDVQSLNNRLSPGRYSAKLKSLSVKQFIARATTRRRREAERDRSMGWRVAETVVPQTHVSHASNILDAANSTF